MCSRFKIACLLAASGAAWSVTLVRADVQAYALTGDGTEFGQIDLTTGAWTDIGYAGAFMSGLGVGPDGTIYTAEQGGFSLVSVDVTSGSPTFIGGGQGASDGLGSTADGKLYGLNLTGVNIFTLYSINLSNGASTLIGQTGLAYPTSTFPPQAVDFDLSVGADQLYFADSSNLYRLNTSTGAATLIGSMGDGVQIGAMVFEAGQLYASADEPTFSVATIDTGSGLASFGPDVSGGPSSIIALAPVVPEPATVGLLAVAGLILPLRRRR